MTIRITRWDTGAVLWEGDVNTDPEDPCGAGINVATLDWCLANHWPAHRVLIVEFTAADIAAIPAGTDGKFRLWACQVIAEKDIRQLVAAVGRA